MKNFFNQLKWQFILLQKNNIISISFGVTFFYGLILYALRDIGHMDKVLTSIVLNDPATIGFFFIGLIISTEKKNEVLSALFTTPINPHVYLTSKVLALSLVGLLCSLGLAIPILGFSFHIFIFSFGAFGICVISALLGIIMITYTLEFLKFVMKSILVFLIFLNLPLTQYLGIIDIGLVKYLLPLQGGLDLISNSYNAEINIIVVVVGFVSIIFWSGVFYYFSYRLFKQRIINI